MEGDTGEAIVPTAPKADAWRKLEKRWPSGRFDPVVIRLVRHRTDGGTYHLATIPVDTDCIPADDLADLYHDGLRGQTERGVRQELYARFNLIAMTRLL